VRAVNTVSGVVTTLRALDRDDGLAWLGLARRRPLRSALTFSAGLAVGTGLGFLFAPMAGADMRSALWGRLTTKRTSEPVATVDAAPQPESASPNRAPVARDSGASKLPNTGLPS
jgi:hypothetical protein